MSAKAKADQQALTVQQAAKRLGVTPVQLGALIEEGKLRALNIGTGQRKRLRIPSAWVEAFKCRRDGLGNPK